MKDIGINMNLGWASPISNKANASAPPMRFAMASMNISNAGSSENNNMYKLLYVPWSTFNIVTISNGGIQTISLTSLLLTSDIEAYISVKSVDTVITMSYMLELSMLIRWLQPPLTPLYL